MNDDLSRRQKLAELDAEIHLQDARAAQREDQHRTALVAALTDIEMGRLAGARDAIAAQVTLLAERLKAVLGEDFGVSGEQAVFGTSPDLETGELVVGMAIGGRTFSFGPEDSLLVWRLRDDGALEYATLGDDGEAIEPWQVWDES